MKLNINYNLSLAFLFFTITIIAQSEQFYVSEGGYLDQQPPGLNPEIFAPGLVTSKGRDGCIGIGMNDNLIIFQHVQSHKTEIFEMIRVNGKWQEPVLLPFSKSHPVGDFTISPDGITLYFQSNIDVEQFPDGGGGNIWVSIRGEFGWTSPKLLNVPVNSKYHDSFPHLSSDGELYFFSRRPGGYGKSDLYIATSSEKQFDTVKNLGPVLNTVDHEWDPFIAYDGSYIIYCGTGSKSLGEDDLFISFRDKDGNWMEPIHFDAPINSEYSENRPWISLDGRYLFFASTRPGYGSRDIYWVDTKVIGELRPKDL